MRLRRPLTDPPEHIQAGVLFGLWCGLMALLMGLMHLDHLLPSLGVRVLVGAVGLLGLFAAIPMGEFHRRRGGDWSGDAWLAGVLVMALPLLALCVADVVIGSRGG